MNGDDARVGGDVSRETSDSVSADALPLDVPDSAARVFPGERLHLARRYADLLATDGVVRGLIGPREAPRLWTRHLLNSAVLGEAIPDAASVCDIGSGAGLPGLVLAIARDDLQVTLVEPLLRRTTFLSEVVETLGLTNVEVVRGRAEVLHGVQTFDVVTSRAVAPLPRLLEWSMPLVAPHGVLVAMKGQTVATEIEDAAGTLRLLRCAAPEVFEVGDGVVDPPSLVLRVAWADPARVGWPVQSGSRSRNDKRSSKRPAKGRGLHGRS